MAFKVQDFYFKKAKKEQYLARSIYKLEEIDLKYKLLKPNMKVLDLGYHPGSWTQYALKKVGKKGLVIGIDIKPVQQSLLNPIDPLILLQMDAFEVTALSQIQANEPFDILISDMAPNTTGNKTVDQFGSLNLVEKVFQILPLFLKNGGTLVIKVFESHEAQVFLKQELKKFEESHYLRPKSTREQSKEFFVIAKGLKA